MLCLSAYPHHDAKTSLEYIATLIPWAPPLLPLSTVVMFTVEEFPQSFLWRLKVCLTLNRRLLAYCFVDYLRQGIEYEDSTATKMISPTQQRQDLRMGATRKYSLKISTDCNASDWKEGNVR